MLPTSSNLYFFAFFAVKQYADDPNYVANHAKLTMQIENVDKQE